LTSTTPVVVRLLSQQRKRCLATILNSAEGSPWWAKLSAGEQQAFREHVYSAVSVFYDLCRDVVKVTEDDGVRNDLVVDLIRSLHANQRELVDRLKP
jgi:hypothetical protein